MEDKTEDLLNTLKKVGSESSLDRYIGTIGDKYPKDLPTFLNEYFISHDLNVAEVMKRSFIDSSYFYKILRGEKNPRRDKIIAIALGAGMSIEDAQRALEIAREGILYSKSPRDSILIYAINNRLSISSTNALLKQYNESELD